MNFHESLLYGFGGITAGYTARAKTASMDLEGHFVIHVPQLVHFAASMTARLFSIAIAFSGQTLVQSVHPIHPAEHTFLTSGPFQRELQRT